MKNLIALLCFAVSTGAHLTAEAADNHVACKSLSSNIAAQSAAFMKTNSAAPSARVSAASSSEVTLRRMDHKEVTLDAAANEIWFLRARMFNMHCVEANQFQF